MTTYSTVGFADTPPEDVRDASTLLATTQQMATGLSVAVATVFLRIGGGTGRAAYITAFLLLAVIAVGPAIEAVRMRRDAGDAARRRSAAGAGRGMPGPAPAVPAAGTAPADGAGSGGAAPAK